MDSTSARVAADPAREWDEVFATPARFAAFCRLHEVAVFRIALRVLRDRQEAEEVAYDAFLRAHTAYADHRATGEPFSSAPIPYLYRTARNAAIDRHRTRTRRRAIAPFVAIEEAVQATAPRDDAGAREEEQLAAVRACIAALGSPHREVYAHYYLEELTVEEVALAVGLPYDRVRAVLKAAREQIGRLLIPHLLATALGELAAADRALLAPHYFHGAPVPTSADTAFEEARRRLIARLLRWAILFQRLPPEELCALTAYAQERDVDQVAASITELRQGRTPAAPCTPAEAAALVARAVAWFDRRLRAARRRAT